MPQAMIDELSRTNFHHSYKVSVPEKISLAQVHRWLVLGFTPLPRSIELQLAHLPVFDYDLASRQIINDTVISKTKALLEGGLILATGKARGQDTQISPEYWQLPLLGINWHNSAADIDVFTMKVTSGAGNNKNKEIIDDYKARFKTLSYREINLVTADVIQAFDGQEIADGYILTLKEQMAERTLSVAGDNLFGQQGRNWHILYQGKEINMPDSKGMAYIQYLLLHPNKEVAAITLQGLRNKAVVTDSVLTGQDLLSWGNKDEIMDAQTLQKVMKRISILPVNSPERLQLQAYLAGATHSGKSKAFKDTNEKARQAVAAAVNRSIELIYKAHEPLGKHLRNSITHGKLYTYKPEFPISWE